MFSDCLPQSIFIYGYYPKLNLKKSPSQFHYQQKAYRVRGRLIGVVATIIYLVNRRQAIRLFF